MSEFLTLQVKNKYQNTITKMKKIEYKTPEMDIIELKAQAALLNMSNGDANMGVDDD